MEYAPHSGDGLTNPCSGPNSKPRKDLYGTVSPERISTAISPLDISDAQNDPDGPKDAWIMRYDFPDQKKIPRLQENRTEDYARSFLHRAHESHIRPCYIAPLRDLIVLYEVRDRSALTRRGRMSG